MSRPRGNFGFRRSISTSQGFVIPKEGLDEQQAQSIQTGSSMMTVKCTGGPPEYHCTVTLAPLGKRSRAQDEKVVVSHTLFMIADLKLCHPECATGRAVVDAAMPEVTRIAAEKMYGRNLPSLRTWWCLELRDREKQPRSKVCSQQWQGTY
ncbi:hypothetical protein EJ03DRAFT_346792 [Teratosphaeria nubilosa]|uniref:Uncharacterized protein n=1 Tax=Teratosphaeria nubilosa TaxID=161662 RepID=A0A6G1LMX4_9PEZI|nr:hypothetical protein EJ03DRAFT_346792 [Teratosphaeria nubilosa]